MIRGSEFKRISIHNEREKEGMHQDVSELKTLFINHQRSLIQQTPSQSHSTGVLILSLGFRRDVTPACWFTDRNPQK